MFSLIVEKPDGRDSMLSQINTNETLKLDIRVFILVDIVGYVVERKKHR